MPRGRHRHSPPLHRILPPAAVAAAALACAGGSWLAGEPGVGDTGTVVLRGLVTVAAAAAVTGAVLLRRWDRDAGRRVGELTARRAGAEWRAEERQAELEGELDDAHEAQEKLQAALRDKRAELTRLRNEHADLLRRYAHAETERAGALEGRRRLELETAAPARVLTAGSRTSSDQEPREERTSGSPGAPTPLMFLQASEALRNLSRHRARQRQREQHRERDRRREPESAPEAPGEPGAGRHRSARRATPATPAAPTAPARPATPATPAKPAHAAGPAETADAPDGPDAPEALEPTGASATPEHPEHPETSRTPETPEAPEAAPESPGSSETPESSESPDKADTPEKARFDFFAGAPKPPRPGVARPRSR